MTNLINFSKKWLHIGRYILHVIILALLYYGVGSFGEFLESGQRGVMPIPLTAGVGVAILILAGLRYWPSIAIAVLVLKLQSSIPIIYTITDVFGTIIQAVLAAWLLTIFRFQHDLRRVYDVIVFALTVVIIAPLISSSIQNGALFYVSARIPSDAIIQMWLINWFADGVGILVLSSTILIWKHFPTHYLNRYRFFEALGLLICLACITTLTLLSNSSEHLVLLYMILPFSVWAAVRFEQHGASLSALLVAIILLTGGINRIYETGSGMRDLLVEIGFIGITALTAFLVAAAYAERRKIQHYLEQQKEHALTTLHAINDAVITIDGQHRITYFNSAAEELMGWTINDVSQHILTDFFKVQASMTEGVMSAEDFEHYLHNKACIPQKGILNHRDGQQIVIEYSIAPLRQEGRTEGLIIVFYDINKTTSLDAQLFHQASHDSLTGLYNRREFEYQVHTILSNASPAQHCLLYLDIDDFKQLNQIIGRSAGDDLLKKLVQQLCQRVRGEDIFARVGGDEFALLLKHCATDSACNVAKDFLNTARELHFTWEGTHFDISLSIGLIEINDTIQSPSILLSHGDLACHAAKENQGNCIHMHTTSPQHTAYPTTENIYWLEHINHSLIEQQTPHTEKSLILYHQIIQAKDDITPTHHSEILLRIKDQHGQLVLPDTFLPVTDLCKLTPQLDYWVMETVFTYLKSSQRDELLFINLSLLTLQDVELPTYLREKIDTQPHLLDKICFEISETLVISHFDEVMSFVQTLRHLGIRFCLDQFGQSITSFMHLKKLIPDYIKISGQLMQSGENNDVIYRVIEEICQISHEMKIHVIATWLEDTQQLDTIKPLQADYIQGFAIAKPEPFFG